MTVTTNVRKDPFGREHGYRRLSDEETARRMLDTAVEAVRRDGLTVNLELASYEAVIAEAGVVRSTAYRRWPTKSYFYADLLRELAVDARLGSFAGLVPAVVDGSEMLRSEARLLRSAKGRLQILSEILRLTTHGHVERFIATTRWSTELRLTALVESLPDDVELREDLRVGLNSVQERAVSLLSSYAKALADVLGFRPRWGTGDDVYRSIGLMLLCGNHGYSLHLTTNPDHSEVLVDADPLGTGDIKPWCFTALSQASYVVANFIEETLGGSESDARWSEEEIATRLERFDRAIEAMEVDVCDLEHIPESE